MNWLSFAVTIATGFVLSPFLVSHLGDSVYGVWVLVGSLVGYLGLLDFGMTPSIVKYIAEHRARDDQESINRVVTVGLAVFSIIGLVTLALSVLGAFYFDDLFDTPLSLHTAAAVVLLAGVNLSLTLPALVFVGVLRGYQRYDLDAGITSLTVVVRSLLLVALILKGHGIVTVAALTLVFDLLRLAYLVRQAYRLNPAMKVSREYFDRGELRRLFRYGLFVFLITAGRQMVFYTDSIVIGLFLTTAAVTVFFISSRLTSYMRLLVSEMVGVLTPTTSDLNAREDHSGIKELLTISTKYTWLITLPVAAVFFVMGDVFIGLWMGEGYASSAMLLYILTAASVAYMTELPVDTVLLGMGKHEIVAKLTLLQGLANLLLTLLLVSPFGLNGVALGTAIPIICTTIVAFPIYFHRYLKIPLGPYVRRSMVSPLIIQAPFIVLLILLKKYALPTSLTGFFLVVGAAFVPYILLALMVCTTYPERRAFLRLVERLGLKPSPGYSNP